MGKKTIRHPVPSVIITVLLAVLIMGLAASTSIASAASFPDVSSSNPYYTAITDLASRDIIGGYTSGNFGPNDPVTRQQFAKMIVNSLEVPVSQADICPFPDVEQSVPPELYPDHYVAVAAFNGLTKGTTATTFDPYNYITHAQVLLMVERAGGSGGTPAGWTDMGNATRGEVAWMLYTLRNEPKKEMTVSAASSLKSAFTDIGVAFDESHHSHTTFNFDASGTLQQQIESGASVDVFASAAMKQMNALIAENLVQTASVKVFAGNEICLVVPANSTLGIASFLDLTKSSVAKVGYGDPALAPHGVAAEQILHSLGIFDQVKPKVIYAANVTQALQWVESGEVDAGIIFTTEAHVGGNQVKIVATSDPSWHSVIAYPAGVVSATEHGALAGAFVDYVAGAYGQQILKGYGFLAAPTQ